MPSKISHSTELDAEKRLALQEEKQMVRAHSREVADCSPRACDSLARAKAARCTQNEGTAEGASGDA